MVLKIVQKKDDSLPVTHFCLIFMMVSAKCAAPPSGRSVTNKIQNSHRGWQNALTISVDTSQNDVA